MSCSKRVLTLNTLMSGGRGYNFGSLGILPLCFWLVKSIGWDMVGVWLFGLGLVLGLRLAGLVLGWSLILGWRLVNWFGLVPGLRLAWFRWFGLGSWLELDLPDQRPSHVVAGCPTTRGRKLVSSLWSIKRFLTKAAGTSDSLWRDRSRSSKIVLGTKT